MGLFNGYCASERVSAVARTYASHEGKLYWWDPVDLHPIISRRWCATGSSIRIKRNLQEAKNPRETEFVLSGQVFDRECVGVKLKARRIFLTRFGIV